MITSEDIIKYVAAECLPGIPITLDSELDRDLCFDALGRVCLVCALDEAFGIEIADADMEAWATVSDVIKTVCAEVAAKQEPAL